VCVAYPSSGGRRSEGAHSEQPPQHNYGLAPSHPRSPPSTVLPSGLFSHRALCSVPSQQPGRVTPRCLGASRPVSPPGCRREGAPRPGTPGLCARPRLGQPAGGTLPRRRRRKKARQNPRLWLTNPHRGDALVGHRCSSRAPSAARTPFASALTGADPHTHPAGAALNGRSNRQPEARRPRYLTEAAASPAPAPAAADKSRRAHCSPPPP